MRLASLAALIVEVVEDMMSLDLIPEPASSGLECGEPEANLSTRPTWQGLRRRADGGEGSSPTDRQAGCAEWKWTVL